MIIEFMGMPGVGKSTIAALLASEMSLNCVTIDGYRNTDTSYLTTSQRARHRIKSLLTQPRMLARSISCGLRTGRGEELSWMINLARRNDLMRSMQGPLIVDEATLSATCLLSAARSRTHNPVSLLRGLTWGDIVVIVENDPQTAAERIRARGGILSDRDSAQTAFLLEKYLAAQEAIAPQLRVPVIHVRSDRKPALVVHQIRESLRELALLDL